MSSKKKVASAFAMGEKVRIVNPSGYESIRTFVGKEGRIAKASNGLQTVKFDKGTCMFFDDELERVV